MICRHCEFEFDPKRPRHLVGRVDECGDCVDKDVPKTNNKTLDHDFVIIEKGADNITRRALRRQNDNFGR